MNIVVTEGEQERGWIFLPPTHENDEETLINDTKKGDFHCSGSPPFNERLNGINRGY